jgi:hypothetical protein
MFRPTTRGIFREMYTCNDLEEKLSSCDMMVAVAVAVPNDPSCSVFIRSNCPLHLTCATTFLSLCRFGPFETIIDAEWQWRQKMSLAIQGTAV